MRGDFKIDGTWYKGKGLPIQSLANQMASKVGQGTSEYADLTSWSAWIQEDWQEGVGKLRPARRGGFLYGEVESRVPEQLILPGWLEQVDGSTLSEALADARYVPADMTGTFTIGSSLASTKAAIKFTTPSSANFSHTMVWVYCHADKGTVLNFEIRNHSTDQPGSTVLATDSVTVLEENPGYYWHGVQLPYSGTLSNTTDYWITVYPTSGSIQVGYGSSGYPTASRLLTSSSWVEQTGKYMMYATTVLSLHGGWDDNVGTGFFRFTESTDGSKLYAYAGARMHDFLTASDRFGIVGDSGNAAVTSAVPFLGNVYFGNGGNYVGNFWTMDDGESFSDSGGSGSVFARYAGYLWRATSRNLYYTADGVTWTNTDEMTTGDTEHDITGLCGMGDSMYVATAEGLYRNAPGDFMVSVLPWGSLDERNGSSMVNFQGSIYATANGRVVRITQDHQMQDVWIGRDDDLVVGRLGTVQSLAVAGNNLVAFVGAGATGSKPTVWAFSNNNWHHLATLPESPLDADGILVNYSMFYDHATDYLWLMTPQRVTYRLYMPEMAINPYNDPDTLYMPRAWVEWDWFDGPIMEADKDYDSIAIVGENLSDGQSVAVYWKDDDSTGWELLGTVTSNFQELRWSDYSKRPNTKRLKLGLLLSTNDGSSTPRIRAIRVKYHLMVKDWFRWSLAVDVSGRTGATQMMTDGTVNSKTASNIKASLDAVAKSVAPVIYQDVDGTQYEVKVQDANFTYTLHEYNEATTDTWWEGVYRFVLEQVHPGTYTAP